MFLFLFPFITIFFSSGGSLTWNWWVWLVLESRGMSGGCVELVSSWFKVVPKAETWSKWYCHKVLSIISNNLIIYFNPLKQVEVLPSMSGFFFLESTPKLQVAILGGVKSWLTDMTAVSTAHPAREYAHTKSLRWWVWSPTSYSALACAGFTSPVAPCSFCFGFRLCENRANAIPQAIFSHHETREQGHASTVSLKISQYEIRGVYPRIKKAVRFIIRVVLWMHLFWSSRWVLISQELILL